MSIQIKPQQLLRVDLIWTGKIQLRAMRTQVFQDLKIILLIPLFDDRSQ